MQEWVRKAALWVAAAAVVVCMAQGPAEAAGKAKAKPPAVTATGPVAADPETARRYVVGGDAERLVLLDQRMLRVGQTVRGTRHTIFRDARDGPRGPVVRVSHLIEMDCAGARFRSLEARFYDAEGNENGLLSKPKDWEFVAADDAGDKMRRQMCQGVGLQLAPAVSMMELRARLFGLESPAPKPAADRSGVLRGGPLARFLLTRDAQSVTVLDPEVTLPDAYPQGLITLVYAKPDAELGGATFVMMRVRVDCAQSRSQVVHVAAAGADLKPLGSSPGDAAWEPIEAGSAVDAARPLICQGGGAPGPVETLPQLRARYFPRP